MTLLSLIKTLMSLLILLSLLNVIKISKNLVKEFGLGKKKKIESGEEVGRINDSK